MRAPPVASGTRRPARCGRTLPSRRVFFFFSPHPSAATEAGALSTSATPGAERCQAHSWVLKWTHRAREHSPGPRVLRGVSEPRRVGLAERSPGSLGTGAGLEWRPATPGRMRSTEGQVKLPPSGEGCCCPGHGDAWRRVNSHPPQMLAVRQARARWGT